MKIILGVNMNKKDPYNNCYCMQKTCTRRSHYSCGRKDLGSTIDWLWNKTVSSTWIYMQPVHKHPSVMKAYSKFLGSYLGHQCIRAGILTRGPWEVCYDPIPPCWNWNGYTVQLDIGSMYFIFWFVVFKIKFFL